MAGVNTKYWTFATSESNGRCPELVVALAPVKPAWPRNLDGGETAAVPPQAVWPGFALAHPGDLVAVQTPARVPQRALREARARDGPHHRSDAVNLEAARGH